MNILQYLKLVKAIKNTSDMPNMNIAFYKQTYTLGTQQYNIFVEEIYSLQWNINYYKLYARNKKSDKIITGRGYLASQIFRKLNQKAHSDKCNTPNTCKVR